MALQTSGAISLNQIHVEAGGNTMTSASINDTDIRGLIGKGSGATMAFNEWYGASNVLDTQTLVVGSDSTGDRRGFANFSYIFIGGSMSDGTANWKSGAAYRWCYHDSSQNRINLALTGIHSNSGFTSMKVSYISGNPNNPTVTVTRSTTASFATSSYFNYTSWRWDGRTQNPFGTVNGPSKKVEFF
jgi:hypothetical protein